MSIEQTLIQRANSKCELCSDTQQLSVYEVPPAEAHSDKCVLLCASCNEQVIDGSKLDVNHWRCLNDSMWSQVPAVQVMALRMLNRLSVQSEAWAQDLKDMMYLEDDTRLWAEMALVDNSIEPTLDSNSVSLQAGDSVVLIKDLNVKGGGFTAKRGTPVRNIVLTNNPLHIEGRVEGQRIVIIADYTKKF